MHGSLIAVRERRTRLRRMLALEIEATPGILRLCKLAGLSLITTYALSAKSKTLQTAFREQRLEVLRTHP